MTRADSYQRVGGGWRIARKSHLCMRFSACASKIAAGDRYFDTNVTRAGAATVHDKAKLCEACAKGEV
jgi:hypothetical protein